MTTPTIYYVGSIKQPNRSVLRGGQRVTLQHIDILRRHGIPSYAVTSESRLGRVIKGTISVDDVFMHVSAFRRQVEPTQDVVVVPGRYATQLDHFPGARKVLFSQAGWVTFGSLGLDRLTRNHLWTSDDLLSIFTVSESNAELFRQVQPSCSVEVITNAVDSVKFPFSQNKENLILTPSLSDPAKNPLDTQAVIQILRARRASSGNTAQTLEVVELKGYSHDSVSTLLQRARLLLFLSTHEGMPLLMLEALSTGTIVFAWDRSPMSDVLPDRCLFSFGDISGVVAAAETLLRSPESWNEVAIKGRERALEFSPSKLEERVLEVWNNLL